MRVEKINSKSAAYQKFEVLKTIGHDMICGNVLPCTACRYCTEKCPMGLDIPMLIDLYNEQ